MKKALILVFSILLLFSFNCATTDQEVSKTEKATQETEKAIETIARDFDLTGVWIETDRWSGCGTSNETTIRTMKFTQQGDTVHMLNEENNHLYIGKIYNNMIYAKGITYTSSGSTNPGHVTVHDYTLKINQNDNTLEGKLKWTWRSAKGSICDGISNLSYKRKLEE